MSGDPADIVMRRLAKTVEEPPGLAGTGSIPATLHAEAILMQEFDHASTVAYQANQERATLLNLTLVVVGTMITADGIAEAAFHSGASGGVFLPVILGLTLAALLLFGFFSRVIHLSEKYHEALLTMNLIKELYVQQLKEDLPQLGAVFRWRVNTVPSWATLSGASLFTGSIITAVASFMLADAAEGLIEYVAQQGHQFSFSCYAVPELRAPIPTCVGSVEIWGLALDVPVFVVAFMCFALYFWYKAGHSKAVLTATDARALGLSSHLARHQRLRVVGYLLSGIVVFVLLIIIFREFASLITNSLQYAP